MQDLTPYMDPFFGNGTIDLPKPEGIAATWFFIKAQTGNTHPGAQAPLSMISAGAYTGAYPTGYGVNAPNTHATPARYLDRPAALGFAHMQQSGTGASVVEDAQPGDVIQVDVVLSVDSGYRSVEAALVSTDPLFINSGARNLVGKGLKIGVPREYFQEGLEPEVSDAVKSAIGVLEQLGAVGAAQVPVVQPVGEGLRANRCLRLAGVNAAACVALEATMALRPGQGEMGHVDLLGGPGGGAPARDHPAPG